MPPPCFIEYFNNNKTFLCLENAEHCGENGCGGLALNLCDYPILNGKTCDRKLCRKHSHEINKNHHYCTAHFEQYVPISANEVFKTKVDGYNDE